VQTGVRIKLISEL